MRLIVAEKPSLARAIAEALPGPKLRAKHHIRVGDDVVAWCTGHILELAPPNAYEERYGRWRLEDLPIAPRLWKLEVRVRALLESIKSLLKSAECVVHAGDPDREGQLLVDEVLEFLGYAGPVARLLISDLNPEAVRQKLTQLQPNSRFRFLYESALARQRADWLYGMNMTRLYTLLGRAGGCDGVLSVGRVQTPLLGLIVARDRAIGDFRALPYFVVHVSVRTAKGDVFRALWVPGPGHAAHLDDNKRLLSREVADRVCPLLRGQAGTVRACLREKKTEPPPLPYALADLQIDAGKRAGMTAQAVLDTCQRLYERHRLITYPRSDCAYLPEGHYAQARRVLDSIQRQVPSLESALRAADLSRRSRAWNDKKITAHHAIIPTAAPDAPRAALSGDERAVYELVAKRYLAQFYGPHEYLQTRIELEIAGETGVATGRQTTSAGWQELFVNIGESAEGSDSAGGHAESNAPLPLLQDGDPITAEQVSMAEKRTEPPKAFTDASLIAAMRGVSKFVGDPKLKKILTETDGIGTPATRAAIIETLFERGYVVRQGRSIVSTPTGKALIAVLPAALASPDKTAIWEAAMRAIADGKGSLEQFIERMTTELGELVRAGRALGAVAVPGATHKPQPKTPSRVVTKRRPRRSHARPRR